jgi:CHAT domain-containing protein
LAFGDPVVTSSAGPATAGAAAKATRSATEIPSSPAADDFSERGFSVARLPYTRDEVVAISRLFPISQQHVYLGDDAREETVKAEKLDNFRYIHFASHGFIDEAKPGRSGILLSRAPQSSEDGVLQMGEIMRLKMNADLVTLSACSTGLGKLVSGEGILGLTRAFFYSGARNVTVSLWNVNDSATAALMQAYYENLKRGLPKSASLRNAKLVLSRGKNVTWSQPYFWAAFVLVGEGK